MSGPSNSNFRNGRIIYTWTDPNGGETPISNGTIATFTLKAISSGTATFTISGDFYTPEEVLADLSFSGTSINILQEEPSITQIPQVNPTPQVTENIVQPEETPVTNTPTIEETPKQPEPTPSDIKPQPTENTEPQNVIYEATPNITKNSNVEQNLSANANLKSLRTDLVEIIPEFDKNITTYDAYVAETVQNIDVLAVPEDSKSSISITGNNNLQLGNNVILVTVTAENGDKKTYTINIMKSDMANLLNSKLENLAIENAVLIPEFNENEFNYVAEVGSDVSTINVLAIPQIETASVEINGNENLQFGENTVTINVKSENGESETSYTIKVYRKTQEEEQLGEKTEEEFAQKNIETVEPEIDEGRKYGNIFFAIILSIGLIVTVAFLTRKYFKERK